MNTNALAMMYETASGESRLIDENSSPVNSTEKINKEGNYILSRTGGTN